ncbi:mp-binding enzyme family protein [Diaporthe amygdali]|uniref:mp-binding enzyme family protein n=1 Tax=Phomopsis amygdali TaxID=1214568 RepID=UPI0022FEE553|nr:mp-binding enzyme family protein [Diaporthe amygdali]KAJ0107450.1 mp-binding enzyme family protein [Diaporthe amygdali]
MSPPEDRVSEHSIPLDPSARPPHLIYVFEEAVSKHGTREAVVSLHQETRLYANSLGIAPSNGPGLRWTYNDVHRAALRLAWSFESHGVQKGDTVTTFVANGIEWCIVVWACWKIGAVFAPMSTRNLANPTEIRYMFEASAASVFIVDNAETASKVDELISQTSLNVKLRVIADTSGRPGNWVDFSSLLELNGITEEALLSKPAAQLDDADGAVLFFTSGTTSLPKGCPHTHQSIATAFNSRRPIWEADTESRAANFLPNNHMMCFIFTIAFHLRGGLVVYPAGVFTPAAMLNALVNERCNETVMVPTMVYAVSNLMSEQKIPKLSHLKYIGLGGSSVSEKNLEDCSTQLGSDYVCAGYGMSEGMPTRPLLFKTAAESAIHGSPCCGEVALGCSVKICSPDSTTPVPINTPGELHMSGPTVISGYLGGRNQEDFYVKDGKQWFKSGDQAVMDEQNRVAIVGRYKDMIIRGGENISPNAMERVLNTIDGIEAYVVGTEDEIAGENLTGKVIKNKLAQLVKDYRITITTPKIHTTKTETFNSESTSHIVITTWASLLGIPSEDLEPGAQVSSFADSINMMRFRQKIKQETGKILTVEQVLGSTIAEQIALLDEQSGQSIVAPTRLATERRPGGPEATDMVHCLGDEERAAATRKVVEDVLESHGLKWDNVSEVFPAWGNGQAIFTQKRPLSWGFRFVIPTKIKDRKLVRTALEAALEKNPIHCSFFIREDGSVTNRKSLALHVSLKPSRDIFDLVISYAPKPVSTVAELYQHVDDDRLDADFESPMTRAEIVHVKETNTACIIINMNHATHDAMSLQGLFFSDLDLALSNPLSLKDHTPYKIFADMYYSSATSRVGQQGINFHVTRLKDITSHREAAAWPPQRAPEWLLGPRRGWVAPADAAARGFSNPNGDPLEALERRSDGGKTPVSWRGELPSLNDFRRSIPGLTNPVIAKAALALLNIHYTKHTHALFSSLDAGRAALPFVPDSLGKFVDINPADMPGPMFQRIANLIHIDRAESLEDYLRRVQELQNGQTKHCHAPLDLICEALEPDAAEMVLDTCRRQIFNWVPGLGAMDRNPFRNLELLDSKTRGDVGVVFFAGTGGKAGQDFVLRVLWDDANVTRAEAEGWLDDYRAMIELIITSGKERRVGEFVDGVKSRHLPNSG